MRQIQADARKYGVWGTSTPVEYGGAGATTVARALVEMELGRSFIWFTPGGEADNILFHCNAEQEKNYLLPAIANERTPCVAITERHSGSDVSDIRTNATYKDGKWTISGEKIFITRGSDADFAVVLAVTNKKAARNERFTLFLVDRTAGFESQPIETMGSTTPARLIFNDVVVSENNVLGEVGNGWELAMSWIGRGRYLIPSRAVGGASRLLTMGVERARERSLFGRQIGDHQAIGWMIADSEVELEAARWLTLQAAWRVDAGGDARHDSAIAKLYGSNMIGRVVDRVMQIHGGLGYSSEIAIQQWYRDVRLWRIFEGTDEMQKLIISRDLLRGYSSVR